LSKSRAALDEFQASSERKVSDKIAEKVAEEREILGRKFAEQWAEKEAQLEVLLTNRAKELREKISEDQRVTAQRQFKETITNLEETIEQLHREQRIIASAYYKLSAEIAKRDMQFLQSSQSADMTSVGDGISVAAGNSEKENLIRPTLTVDPIKRTPLSASSASSAFPSQTIAPASSTSATQRQSLRAQALATRPLTGNVNAKST